MDWIFDNINLIFVIGGAIAYWLNAKARERSGEPADYDGDGIPDSRPAPRDQTTPMAQESEAQEQARRIRKEIRRKILERTGGSTAAPSPYLAPRPVSTPVEQQLDPPPLKSPHVLPPSKQTHDEDILASQRHLAERIAQLREDREAVELQADRLKQKQITASRTALAYETTQALAASTALADDLKNPTNLRRAIIWQEILGAPVSQR